MPRWAFVIVLASGAFLVPACDGFVGTSSHITDEESRVREVLDRYLRSIDAADVALAAEVWAHGPTVEAVTPLGRFKGWDHCAGRAVHQLPPEAVQRTAPHAERRLGTGRRGRRMGRVRLVVRGEASGWPALRVEGLGEPRVSESGRALGHRAAPLLGAGPASVTREDAKPASSAPFVTHWLMPAVIGTSCARGPSTTSTAS
jgi:hypothetical protein